MDMSILTLTALLLFGMITECGGQPECGQAPLNNGNPGATPGAWPWQVSLHRSGGHFCSGLLITDEWVLSAAHCFSTPGNVTAFVGRHSQTGSNPNEQTRSVSLNISHPAYNSDTFDNDVALLKLSSPVTFDYIRPICLAADGSTFFHGTESFYIVPLPPSGSLTEVEAPVVGNRQCDCDRTQITITDNMICAGLMARGEDACQGNSGGPLLSKQGSTWVLSGLLSFGFDCANPEIPGVFTRVSRYQAWISSHTGNSNSLPGFVSFMSVGTDPDLQVSCNANLALPIANSLNPTPTPQICPLITCPRIVCPTCFCPTWPTSTSLGQNVCGVAPLNNHIFGGQTASPGAWPWQVSLHILGSHFCGGTLINSMWVLSTAHCFFRRLSVTAFMGRQSQLGLNPNEVSRLVVQTIIHPAYNPLTKDNDVALLRLSHPVPFNNFIRPICLAASGSTFFTRTESWVTGWGTIGQGVPRPPPQNLMEVQVPVVGNRRCDCQYGGGVITNNMICAGRSWGGQDACQVTNQFTCTYSISNTSVNT
ncbi:transmembrane protease serine 9-like [Hippocampus comes]|uniref:transmembrane protease serine 9-like n=1 Tax=Hippocampus comes TaxID=109280 RepID=UPI00094E09E3|nr:PREDICTED: transmembrane protease serine 9-like [Hippocampus comes]